MAYIWVLAWLEQFFRGIKCDLLLAKRAWKQIQAEDEIEMQKRKREAVLRAFEANDEDIDMNKVCDGCMDDYLVYMHVCVSTCACM
jgi:hypothetical protein